MVFQAEQQDPKGKSTESASSLSLGHPGPRRLSLDTIRLPPLARLHWHTAHLEGCSRIQPQGSLGNPSGEVWC